jgi:hypothetical protein
MKLESSAKTYPATETADRLEWGSFCRLPNISMAQPEAATWVRLLYPPTDFSFDQAWLLCEMPGDRWLAWVPDHGEILLTLDDFVSDF